MNPCRRITPLVCLFVLVAATPLFAQRHEGAISLSLASAAGGQAETAFFKSIDGLATENEVVEYSSGAEPDVTRKIPGRLKFSNITLKRGLTGDLSLYAWRKRVEDGQFDRRNGTIAILDQAGRPVARYYLENAWPAKCHIETDALTGAVLEVIVLAVDRSYRQ
jgi:phage tail-like protein